MCQGRTTLPEYYTEQIAHFENSVTHASIIESIKLIWRMSIERLVVMKLDGLLKQVLMILCMGGFLAEPVFAQNTSDQQPVSVKGFDYKFIPSGRIHMNSCRAKKCVPGSIVSYSLFGPDRSLDFDGFKIGQQRATAYLQKRAKKGVKITLEKANRTKDRIFTIFTSYRKTQPVTGSKLYTLSTVVYGKKLAISIISSAKTKKVVEANRAIFLIELMALDQVIKQ